VFCSKGAAMQRRSCYPGAGEGLTLGAGRKKEKKLARWGNGKPTRNSAIGEINKAAQTKSRDQTATTGHLPGENLGKNQREMKPDVPNPSQEEGKAKRHRQTRTAEKTTDGGWGRLAIWVKGGGLGPVK